MVDSLIYLADHRCIGLFYTPLFALVLEASGACFHFISSDSQPASRHITRFAAPSIRQQVKILLDFRNSISPSLYTCDEFYKESTRTFQKLHLPHLVPTTSQLKFVWVQRKLQVSSTSYSSPHPVIMDFSTSPEFLHQVKVLLHVPSERKQLDILFEETPDALFSRTLSGTNAIIECWVKHDDSFLTRHMDGFVSHVMPHQPGKRLYAEHSMPIGDCGYELQSIVSRMFDFTLPSCLTDAPLPWMPSQKVHVLFDMTDSAGNTFTALSDHSVYANFHDRTVVKVAARETKTAQVLLPRTGENVLVTFSLPFGEVEDHLRRTQTFMSYCFLDACERSAALLKQKELEIRIHTALKNTKRMMDSNQIIIAQTQRVLEIGN